MSHKSSINYVLLGRNMKPGKELYIEGIFGFYTVLIISSIATLSYSFNFFFWSVNYTNMVYILYITFGKCQDTQTFKFGTEIYRKVI